MVSFDIQADHDFIIMNNLYISSYALTDKEEDILANDRRTVIRTIHTSYFENLSLFLCNFLVRFRSMSIISIWSFTDDPNLSFGTAISVL
jgi:hypothetical protein